MSTSFLRQTDRHSSTGNFARRARPPGELERGRRRYEQPYFASMASMCLMRKSFSGPAGSFST